MSTLIANVQVDGVWYGPAYGSTEVGAGIPPEAAVQIGAHAWSDGVLPDDDVAPEPPAPPKPVAQPEPDVVLPEPPAEPEPDSGRRGRGRSKG